MLVTNHVLAGALIGRVMSRHPVGAFVVGMASHFAMDCCPHFGDESWTRDSPEFLRLAYCDGCCGLAAMAIAAGLSPGRSRKTVIAAMAGAAVVDSDKPLEHFFDWNPWPEKWNQFHKRIQNEEPNRLPIEVGTALVLGVAGYFALRRG